MMEEKIVTALSARYPNFTWAAIMGKGVVLITAVLTVNDRPMTIEVVHAISGFVDERLFPATVEYVASTVADAVADRLLWLEEND